MALTYTISAAEATYMLRRELGPLRNWYEFLHDARRNGAVIAGHTLLPCCSQHDGLSWRPRYDVEAVKAFIRQVRAAIPAKVRRAAIEPVALNLDGRCRHWQDRRHDKTGNRIAPKSQSALTDLQPA